MSWALVLSGRELGRRHRHGEDEAEHDHEPVQPRTRWWTIPDPLFRAGVCAHYAVWPAGVRRVPGHLTSPEAPPASQARPGTYHPQCPPIYLMSQGHWPREASRDAATRRGAVVRARSRLPNPTRTRFERPGPTLKRLEPSRAPSLGRGAGRPSTDPSALSDDSAGGVWSYRPGQTHRCAEGFDPRTVGPPASSAVRALRRHCHGRRSPSP